MSMPGIDSTLTGRWNCAATTARRQTSFEAVNAVFEGDNALLLPEVAFEPAQAAAVHDEDLRIEDANYDPKPFQLHLFAATRGR